MIIDSGKALLKRAKSEELVYNWHEAAILYKQVAEGFLMNDIKKDSAIAFNKLGYAYSKAALSAESSEDYFDHCNCAIDAYEKARSIFKETGNKPMELESEALMFYVTSISQSSLIKAKEAASKSIDLLVESSEGHSKKGDKEGIARTLSKAATISVSLILYCSELEEVLEVARKGREISEKARRISEEIKNVQYIAAALSSEFGIVSDMTVYKLEYQILSIFPKRIAKWSHLKCEKYLKLIEDTNDSRVRATIYNVVGRCYIDYGLNYIEEETEQQKYFLKAIELLEKSVEYAINSKDKSAIILNLYEFFQAIAVSGKIDYLVKKRVEYFPLLRKFSEIFATSINFWNFFVNIALANYYSNAVMYSQDFLTPTNKKPYGKKGIEYALKALKMTTFTPFCVHLYVILTNIYSMLTYLTKKIDKQEDYAKILSEFARKAEDIGKDYDEGYPQPTRPQFTYNAALYVAYKTLADISEVHSEKAEMLQKSASALEESTVGIKHLRLSIESKLSLGALYEEISILTKDVDKLNKAKEIFIEAIQEALKTGYTAARITAYASIARIEDRLGNFTASADNYEKVKSLYSEMLKITTYEVSKEEIKQKRDYNNVWSLIERARAYHKIESHLKARDNYIKARKILEILPNFNYEAPYYGAWALLEDAEQFSHEEKIEDALEMYNSSKQAFINASDVLKKSYDQIKDKLKNERLEKLVQVAKMRIDYCNAKINLEEAKILEKQSKHLVSAEKFALAASQFENICKLFEGEQDQTNLRAIYYLCKAWETMQLAEEYEEHDRYEVAANLFKKAQEFFTDTKLKLLASGNSAICQALKFGHDFDKCYEAEPKGECFSNIRQLLSEAASFYGKGGFKNGEYWALATSMYFEAMWNLDKAQEELDLKERKRFLEDGSKSLHSAIKLFQKAGYEEKVKEVQARLTSLEKEESVLLSVSNIFILPPITGSTFRIKAPSCPVETSQSIKIEDFRKLAPDLRKVPREIVSNLIELKHIKKTSDVKDVLVFVSYATKDSIDFKIRDIAEFLTECEKISNVLYWQEDLKDNIIKYMNDNLGKCDIMLLFCSPNALTSVPVEKEWTAADIMEKPIIPVFNDPDHIPPLLKPRLGIQLDPLDFKKNLDDIYNLIVKKLEY
ncbi:MAG: TIR domain-containing protein [Candidatus Lokiarchaeota archaeon]|nr:TIR domain-containing protein [Candidatus Lokiarchaeota archaeon]